ncbi:TIGR03564 family F420-dependent LLM class oxidoreductase [Thermomonospora catenispora]|uniref:TIGR03564 family F420-dependent LLM class oxidoreductase n=1 Tax=Thermomonospora catenispora TaxID=2493090 RepID=UPI0011209743|nr:TIGR03564 family F420-dependent LLM class oxidoreductase [Thermomonospora catenispora]TNY37386.1 TIGR03564 family F420-dependent LLM class oxidoreductase [Thermomonospora catenispora]
MLLGVHLFDLPSEVDEIVARARAAAAAGFHGVYFSHVDSWDALGLAALVAREVSGIEVGTAVTPTYPTHPMAMAAQALTAQAAAGGRLTLGVGPSHPPIVEGRYGLRYERPVRHVREYLTVLTSLLRGEEVDFRGETLSASGGVRVPVPAPPAVLLAALGPMMLRLAGELADGTVTTWTRPEGIGEHVAPAITRAAAAAGRPDPRIVVTALVSVTADPEGVRERVAESLGMANGLPAYRAMLDRQGLSAVHETVIAGDETEVERTLRAYADAGATELAAGLIGDADDRRRTWELLSSLAGGGRTTERGPA